MNISIRTNATLLLLASLCGCGTVQPVTSSIERVTTRILHPLTPAPSPPYNTTSASVDAYKLRVAEHVVRNNSSHTFAGPLPPMLPAIVVLNITVDREGRMTRVAVQRSRDPDASKVAVASMERCGRLPKPDHVLAGSNSLTFSETFLFNADYRFQLRTLAGPQYP
jgi:protein TonB